MKNNGWSKVEIEFAVKEFQQFTPIQDIADAVGKTKRQVCGKLNNLGFQASMTFDPMDDVWLRRHYSRAKWQTLFDRFPEKTKKHIYERANKLGLTREQYESTGNFRSIVPGMGCAAAYGMTKEELKRPPLVPPKDPSTTVHPALRRLWS